MVLEHVQVNEAANHRRRTYRAHGRINNYCGCPCHVEMVLVEKPEQVKKGAQSTESSAAAKKKTVSKKKLARQRQREGLRQAGE